jgi:hypothetical protein
MSHNTDANKWREESSKGLLGEDFKQDIPISSIDKSTKKLDVELKKQMLKMIYLKTDTPDEFFVCAYHSTNPNNNNNSKVESISFEKQNDASIIEYFDCNEGDLLSIKQPTESELFTSGSEVYAKAKQFMEQI